MPSLKKGDLFKIEWEKLIATPLNHSDPKELTETKAYQKSLASKFGNHIFTALKVRKIRGTHLVEYELPDHSGFTGVGLDFVVKVKNVVQDFVGEIGDVAVLCAKTADYSSQTPNLQVNNIWNIPKIHSWMMDRHERNLIMHDLLSDNRKKFKSIFGPPSFYFQSEFKFHCWVISLGSILSNGSAQLLILTANGKGTCYEAIISRGWLRATKIRKDEDLIIRFLELLETRLEEE
jgi:hypothetical protein